MIQLAIHEAINGRDLDYTIARATMEEMMDGTATDIEMATLLTALRMKGETITEITACAEVMREKGAHIEPKGAVMDIVGTGGDEVGSFNISTTAAFVAATGGVPVAKHGNRSVSSKSGAADVLEELGVVLSLSPEQNERVLAETGICFLFAQGYHKSMKNVAPVRKGMGERTIFNVLGPLSNPARATMQLLGVYDESLVMPMAQVLSNLGVTRGMVVCGGGMDEASLIGRNKVCEIRDGELTPYELDPTEYGLSLCTVDELCGGSPKANAQITRDILAGREQGAKREEILLNAGIALYLGLDGLTLADGIKKAAEAAEADFDLKFKEHGFPADAPIFAPDLTPDENGLVYVAKILVDAGVAGTASEARRLIDGGGVKVNGEALAPKAYNVAPEVLAGAEVQVGKKKFVRFE